MAVTLTSGFAWGADTGVQLSGPQLEKITITAASCARWSNLPRREAGWVKRAGTAGDGGI